MNNHIQYFLWVRLSYYALLFDTLCKRGAWLTKLPWKLDTSAQLHPTDNYAMELLTHVLISDNLRPLVLVEEVNCYYRVPHVISSPDLLLYGYLRRACLWLIYINCGTTPAWKTISQPPCTTPTAGKFACYWGYTRDSQWWEFPPVICIVIYPKSNTAWGNPSQPITLASCTPSSSFVPTTNPGHKYAQKAMFSHLTTRARGQLSERLDRHIYDTVYTTLASNESTSRTLQYSHVSK